ncbi:vesicular glutamate transporter 3-like [Phlebotomus argentipes]|uniref:vesicular glutamate transporter 3-like n=1 Tax=Phlebotomus argentipes TaxID=94469 RepID=UPI002892E4A0|nr:vesicular glutamate transporter 3-like [Phlebotomus argentipes]
MTFLSFISIYLNRVCLSVAIVEMTRKFEKTVENGTIIEDQHFNWDSKQHGIVLSSFFYGYICTQIIGGILASRFGGYYILLCGVGGSAVMTLLAPVAASTSIYFLIAVRIVQGFFEGFNLSSMHAILSRWAPVFERSRMTSFCIMGCFIGTVIGMSLSGVLVSQLGWQSVFYCFGTFGILWCCVWIAFIRPYPETDSFISKEEATYIVTSIGNEAEEKKKIVHPWKKILTSTAVWAIMASHFADNWTYVTFLTQLPTFLRDIIGLEVQASGIISAIPYIIRSCFLAIGGYLADWCQIKGYLTTRQVRRYFNCGAFLFISASMLFVAFLENSVAIVVFLSLIMGLGGFSNVGFMINPLDLAPQHASVIFGVSGTVACLSGIASPLITGMIVIDKTREQWQNVFFINVGINIAGCIFYWIFAKAELQPWAKNRNIVRLEDRAMFSIDERDKEELDELNPDKSMSSPPK